MSFELFRVEKDIKWDNRAMPILLSLSGQEYLLRFDFAFMTGRLGTKLATGIAGTYFTFYFSKPKQLRENSFRGERPFGGRKNKDSDLNERQ